MLVKGATYGVMEPRLYLPREWFGGTKPLPETILPFHVCVTYCQSDHREKNFENESKSTKVFLFRKHISEEHLQNDG